MMECSILQDLAVFDTDAPISVSISFEDSDSDYEGLPIKTEAIEKDDNNQTTKQVPNISLKIKTEIKEEPLSLPEINNDVKADEKTEHTILRAADICSSQSLQSSMIITAESRKRKQTQLQIYKNKKLGQRSVKESDSSRVQKNACESEISTPTSNQTPGEMSFMSESNPNVPSGTDLFKNYYITNSHTNKLSSYIKGCLSSVSEHMRLILEAYLDHKRNNTPKENFYVIKKKLFNLSYSTVVTMLLPEETNTDFLKTFLDETYRHACERPSIYNINYKDYETLLNELLLWAKHNKSIIDKAAIQKGRTHNTKNQNITKPVQTPPNNNIEVNKSANNVDNEKICLFSAGPQGNEISINIDQTLKKYLNNTCTTNSLEIQRLNSKFEQKQLSQMQFPQCDQSKTKNDQTSSQQPQLVQTPSQQQIVSRYGHTSEILPQCIQATSLSSQYGPTHHAQPSRLQQQYCQPQAPKQQSKQPNNVQKAAVRQPPQVLPQNTQQQRHHSHNPPPYNQLNHAQWQFKQQQQLLPQYLQSQQLQQNVSPFHGVPNYMPPQPCPTQHSRPQVPQYGHFQSEQPQNMLPQYAQTQPITPPTETSLLTGWHRQTNMVQLQTQAVGGSPRSVSTDSGFISPLNFVSSDQTAPLSSEEAEIANLLITHVTSLNPGVTFMDEDKCVVCKKQTKKVCMGCMQCYYCSYDCQIVDWSNHEPNCKANKQHWKK